MIADKERGKQKHTSFSLYLLSFMVECRNVLVCGKKMQMLRLHCRKLNKKEKQVLQQLFHLSQIRQYIFEMHLKKILALLLSMKIFLKKQA